MNVDYCVKCGHKSFEQSFCGRKWRCSKCGYFLIDQEFQSLKKEAEKRRRIKDGSN